MPLLFIFIAIIVIGIILTFTVFKPAFSQFTKLAELMPDEKVLLEENDVKVTTTSMAQWGYNKVNLKITDKRIISFMGKTPVQIIDYTSREKPKQLKSLRPEYFLVVDKAKIAIKQDEKGNKYLEVLCKPRLVEAKIRFFLKGIDRLKEYFVFKTMGV